MTSKREYYTVTQWNNVLRGLSVAKAKQEIADTTLKIKVLRENGVDLPNIKDFMYDSKQRYIHVSVVNDQLVTQSVSVIIDVLYVGL